MGFFGWPCRTVACPLATLVMVVLLWSCAADAQPLSSAPATATVREYAVTLCLGTLEEMTGRPPWQLVYLRGAELVQACHDAPYPTMARMKGVGYVIPSPHDRRPTGAATPR